MRSLLSTVLALASATSVAALGQESIISFEDGILQLVGGDVTNGQILVSSNDYWGVIRAAGDLAVDFGRVTGTNFTLSNGEDGAEPATYDYLPVNNMNNTYYTTLAQETFYGPEYSDPSAANTLIIAGTVGNSTVIDALVAAGKINVTEIEGLWESFVTTVVESPVDGCDSALVIAGSDARGTIYGIYDVSEQIGVSPWYFWADVPTETQDSIYVTTERKVQGEPSVKYRGFFLNDEQPGLTNWVATNFPDTPYGAGYGTGFYSLVFELMLRLRGNYLWPALWGTMMFVDDPGNQPLGDAYQVVLGTAHTAPMQRNQNEYSNFYSDQGDWAYNLNNETIDEYFRYGVERAKPYAGNSIFTMSMRGTGDTEVAGNLGIPAIIEMLEVLIENQREILKEGLDLESASDIPQLWCLYKEVQAYATQGLTVDESITFLWSDDNWGNIRRMPLSNETDRSGGAGVYYHFDYVGDTRDYKWINTIQLQKTAEQMALAYARESRRIWIVNVGDLKSVEVPLTHFLDMAYNIDTFGVDDTEKWLKLWAAREWGSDYADEIADIVSTYGMYAGRRKFELVEPRVYSILNYNEAEAVLVQWAVLKKKAEAVYASLPEEYQPSFYQLIMQPIAGAENLYKIQVAGAKNNLYGWQKRNAANTIIEDILEWMEEDSNITDTYHALLDGKWDHMMDQTHLGYDGYWQQPMRDSTPMLRYVQTRRVSLAGHVGVGVEGSNASVTGDDQFHSNSGYTLEVPSMDQYGPLTRYFDVFWRGTNSCDWTASPEADWITLSQYSGTVGPNGSDTRVLISIDWDTLPDDFEDSDMYINITTPCQGLWTYAYQSPKVYVPVQKRTVPDDFTEGFVESDGHIAIEGPHYQRTVNGTNEELYYHTFSNYGRTLGGVGLFPLGVEKASIDEAPAIEYDMYFFTNTSEANVTVWVSPSENYLTDDYPLEYGIALFPQGDEPDEMTMMQPVSGVTGTNMPDGWAFAVADSVWGQNSGNMTTTMFDIPEPGAYTLRIKALLPSLIVQKIIIDVGGVRESYLGPPESFLVGRDTVGEYNQTSFINTPDAVGGVGNGNAVEFLSEAEEDSEGAAPGVYAPAALAAVVAAMSALMML